MTILINNAILANTIFYAIFIVVILASIKLRQDQEVLPIAASQELKGLAILTIVFAHVAYALVSDSRFLFPLSTMAGVGVNLFLMLSGYGLVISALKKPLTIWQFYKYRLSKLFLPFWLVLISLFAIDALFLKINYGWPYMAQSFLGFFNHANLYTDVNSPFWYLTLIIFYYLIFPILFIRKRPWLSALLIYAVSFLIISAQPNFLINVIHLHRIHLMAFPIGLIIGSLLYNEVLSIRLSFWLQKIRSKKYPIVYALLLLFFSAVAIYSFIHAGIGEKPYVEEIISIISCLSLLAIAALKRFEIKALYWIGFFSYEIYLFHWPLMYRYYSLFKLLPPWLAMLLYLIIFIALGWLMQKLIFLIGKKKA